MTGDERDLDEGLEVARAYYVMGLRDLLPLAVGCHFVRARHGSPDGLDDAVCWLVQVPIASESAQDLVSSVAGEFVARDGVFANEAEWDAAVPSEVPLAVNDYRRFEDASDELEAVGSEIGHQAYFDGATLATVAITGGSYGADERHLHWGLAFRLLVEWIDALRASDAGPLPAISDVESIHPFYLRVVESPDSTRRVNNIIIDEAGMLTKWHQPISRDVTNEAAVHFIERRNGSPVALIRDWVFRAISAKKLGDHGQAVVYSAIAAEQAISHVLCMLQWEDNQRFGTAEGRELATLFQSHVRDSGKLLGEKLAFEHDVTEPGCAAELRAWHRDVAQVRNRVMHSGHYPSAHESESAVDALYPFINYLFNKVATNAKNYPKCASVLCSPSSISTRRTRRTVERLRHKRHEFVREYSDELQHLG